MELPNETINNLYPKRIVYTDSHRREELSLAPNTPVFILVENTSWQSSACTVLETTIGAIPVGTYGVNKFVADYYGLEMVSNVSIGGPFLSELAARGARLFS